MPELSTSSWIVAAISAGLVVLIAVAYAAQAIEKNNRERRRLETALKLRSSELRELLDTLPASLLGRELRLLVCQGLEDVYQQLHKLNPRHSAAELDEARELRASIALEPEQMAYQPLTSAAQVKDVQRQLRLLHSYLLRLRNAGRLTQGQAQQHVRKLQHLLVLTTLDGYQLASQQALQADKPRLAVHYLELALERMQKHNPGGVFESRIQQTEARIAELELAGDGGAEEIPVRPDTSATESPAAEAWEEFEHSEESWKKKTLYD